jgi:hypothetical protein
MSIRIQETVAMMMIGDGVLAASRPQEHCSLWLRGPGPWQQAVGWFVDHPQVTRALGIVEVAAGLWWSFRLSPSRSLSPRAVQSGAF